jgi:hypothetical protein
MNKEIILPPEKIVAVKDIIESKVGINFKQLFQAYSTNPDFLEYRDGKELTKIDLINDILESGKNQLEDEASFDEIVITGVLTIAASFGLI